MAHGENLDFDHQSAASKARWNRATPLDRAKLFRAQAVGLLRKANELDPQSEPFVFAAEQNHGEKDTTPLSEVTE